MGVEERPERTQHLPQLVVTDPAVEGHQPAHEVEGLEGDIVTKLLGPHSGEVAGHGLERRADIGDEAAARLDERLRHCGSRHMGQIVGPDGKVTSPVTSKP